MKSKTFRTMAGIGQCAVLLLFSIGGVRAQIPFWERYYGGESWDFGHSVVRVQNTPGGGFLAVGFSQPSNISANEDLYALKVDNSGTIIWQKTYELVSGSFDRAQDVVECANGDFIITGVKNGLDPDGSTEHQNPTDCCNPTNSGEIILVRIRNDGRLLWARNYGGIDDEIGLSVILAKHGPFPGDIVVAGRTRSFGAGADAMAPPYSRESDDDAFIMRADSNGMLKWMRTFGSEGRDVFTSIDEAGNGDLVAAGSTKPPGALFYSPYVVRTTHDGMLDPAVYPTTFAKSYTVADGRDVFIHAVKVCGNAANAGNIIMTGASTIGTDPATAPRELYFLYTNASGAVIANATHGDGLNDADAGLDVVETFDDGFVAVGYSHTPLVGILAEHAYAVKVDNTLALVTSKLYGGNEIPWDSLTAVDEIRGSGTWGPAGFIMTGWRWDSDSPTPLFPPPTGPQLLLIKVATNLVDNCEYEVSDVESRPDIIANVLAPHTMYSRVMCPLFFPKEVTRDWSRRDFCPH